MDATRHEKGSPAGSRDKRGMPPFGGLGFDFCGLGRSCAKLSLRRHAAAPGRGPAGAIRA